MAHKTVAFDVDLDEDDDEPGDLLIVFG